jgi:hypothetical protein
MHRINWRISSCKTISACRYSHLWNKTENPELKSIKIYLFIRICKTTLIACKCEIISQSDTGLFTINFIPGLAKCYPVRLVYRRTWLTMLTLAHADTFIKDCELCGLSKL